MEERLQKLIARAGICSRRKAEELILEGRVKVNGVKATIGQKADPKTDDVTVDRKPLRFQKKRYFLLYKPRSYVTTMKDEFRRPCVNDLLETLHIREKLFTVGRLDYDSEGLMIATNDGELANKIAHPRFEIQKTYRVVLGKPFSDRSQMRIKNGVVIDEKEVKVSELVIHEDPKVIELTIHEGRNRIVRKIMEKLGYKVMRLIRVNIGELGITGLREGQFREVTREIIEVGVKAKKKPAKSEPKDGLLKKPKSNAEEKRKRLERKSGPPSKSQLKRREERQNRYSKKYGQRKE
jgi:pseudouridine synthase